MLSLQVYILDLELIFKQKKLEVQILIWPNIVRPLDVLKSTECKVVKNGEIKVAGFHPIFDIFKLNNSLNLIAMFCV